MTLFPFRSDPRDARFYGTEAYDLPGNASVGQYRLRCGRWRALWRSGACLPLDVEGWWRPCPFIAIYARRDPHDAFDLHVIVGSLHIELYSIDAKATAEDVARELAQYDQEEAEAWAEEQGLIPCRYCRAFGRSLPYCRTYCAALEQSP